jgi:hypothetical protein
MATAGRPFLLLPLFLVLALGCNKSATPAGVSGKVTYKGQPVPAGSITFHLPAGGIFKYPIRDGAYSGSDLPAGEMAVTIETESQNTNDPTKPKRTYGQGKDSAGGGAPDYAAKMKEAGRIPAGAVTTGGEYVKIPEKYATKEKSPLKVTLTNGKNVNDFDLTD